jgi:hypothetical protein
MFCIKNLEVILPKRSIRFWIGIFFIISSYPLNAAGIALSAFLTYSTGNASFLSLIILIYIISWLWFLLGVYFAKEEGIGFAKNLLRKILQLFKKRIK